MMHAVTQVNIGFATDIKHHFISLCFTAVVGMAATLLL
jgi:hypothetical protein